MASLKKELEAVALRLGDEGGQAASSKRIGISVPAATTVTYVAPSNGFISFQGKNDNDGGWSGINVGLDEWRLCSGINIKAMYWISGFLPVRKGDAVKIFSENKSKYDGVCFIPTVGSTS